MNKTFLKKSVLRSRRNLFYAVICASVLSISATVNAQTVNLNAKNASILTVMKQIKKQTGYSFAINEKHAKAAKLLSIDTKGELKEALFLIFANQPFSYKLEGNIIITIDKEVSQTKVSSPQPKQQQQGIRGIVLDSLGVPLKAVSIYLEKDRRQAVQTDASGHFVISGAFDHEVFTFSLLGYEKKQVLLDVQPDRHIIKLRPIFKNIDEVVVNTGIFNRNKETYTGAVTVVTGEELATFGNRNVITSLRNFDPSFNLVENNSFGSDPNRKPEIQIRGNSSLPNVNELKDDTRVGINTPLIVFDGFESTLERLMDINQNEVESVTILKDAAATAIYGSRGANGVIVVKTKLPKPGKLRISYQANLNLESPDLTAYSLLNAREKLELERITGLYNSPDPDKDLTLKQYYSFLLSEVNRGVETDWLSQPLRLGVGQRHSLSFSGGSEAFRYSASAYMNDLQGAMKGSSRSSFSGTVNLSYNLKNIRFNNNLTINEGKSANSPYGSFDEYVKLNPYWAPYDKLGNLNKLLGRPEEAGINKYSWDQLPTNPMYNAGLNTYDITHSTMISNNFSLDWNILPTLILRARMGINKVTGDSDRYLPSDHTAFANTADFFKKGSYDYGINKNLNYDAGVNLNYSANFGKHAVFAGLDYNIRQMSGHTYSFAAEGFIEPRFDFLAMAMQYQTGGKPNGTEFIKRAVGVTSSVNYSYDNRYIIEGSARVDGASQFGKMNRFAPFWSLGLAWNIKRESFLKDLDFIDDLKIRGSVGSAGSQNFDAYQALATYKYMSNDRYFGWIGADLTSLGNENLKWQQEMSYNLGIQTGFFKNRLLFGADMYKSKTDGLISSVNLPASSGFDNYIENIGTVSNRGIEFKLTYIPIKNPNSKLNWSLSAAIASNSNKIDKLSDALKDAQKEIEENVGTSPATLYREGNPIASIWAVRSLGIDPSTGKELFLDRNGKPTFVWSSLDLVATGIGEPKYRGNLSSSLRYKNFSMNLVFGYKFGGQLYNNTLISRVENVNYRYNVDSRVYHDRWKEPGDQTFFKGIQVMEPTNASSRFVQDEHVLTLQNLYLAYEIRNSLTKRLRLSNLSVGTSMGDVFYLSSVKQERGTGYPFSRQISLTLNAMF